MKSSLFILFFFLSLTWNACGDKTTQTNQDTAGLVYNQTGEMTLFGKKIEFDNLKPALKEALANMPAIPNEIPVNFEGEIGMGTRGEIETQVDEAVFEAKHTNAVADVIHGFYTWYLVENTEGISTSFLNDKGQHLKLDLPKLDVWLAIFKNSGFVSDEFIENEKVFYKRCEAFWQKESMDEPPSCLDADRFTCLQDAPELLIDHFTKAPIAVSYLSEDRMAAKILEGGWENNFELKLETGKWLLAKIECDLLPEG